MADFALINWANARTRGHENLEPCDNIKEAWGNGKLWAALLYAYFPEKIPIKDLNPKTPEEHMECCRIAFKVATEAGCEPYLDPEDVVYVQDKKSILVYLSEIYNITKPLPVKHFASAAWEAEFDRKKKEEQMARFKAQYNKDQPGAPTGSPQPKKGSLQERLAAQRAAEEAEEAARSAKPAAAKPAAAAATPAAKPAAAASNDSAQKAAAEAAAARKAEEERKKKEQEQKLAEEKRKKEEAAKAAAAAKPAAPVVSSAPVDAGSLDLNGELTYVATGKAQTGGPAKAMLIFSVAFKIDGRPIPGAKEHLQVFVDSPSSSVRLNVMVGSGGYNIGFTPDTPGQYWFDFVYHGKWCDKPLCVPIKNNFNKTPDHPYTGKERQAAGK